MKCKVGVLVPVCAQAHKQQAQQQKEPDIWANAGPAIYVHLGKAGPGLSHSRL